MEGDWKDRHFRQDGSLVGTMLAFGLSSLAVLAAFYLDIDLSNDSMFALAVVFGPILVLPGPIVLVARLVRRGPGGTGGCEHCGARPAADVRYLQVTGIVVLVILKEARLRACSKCSGEAYVSMTGHTGLLGWWSLLSLLVVPWVVVANTLAWIQNKVRTRGTRASSAVLDEDHDYAANLLRTKDRETVVEVLAAKSGIVPGDVAKWIDRRFPR